MKFLNFCIFFLLLIIYYRWISLSGTFSSGDWPYLYFENIKEFSFIPKTGSIWLSYYYQPTSKLFVEYLGASWEIAERLLWFWPFLILCIASSYYLTKSWVGVFIYSANTYILMVVGGGQMGVAMAYSMAPLVLGLFIGKIQNLSSQRGREELRIYSILFASLTLSLQIMFDPRIAFITIFAVVIYFLIVFVASIRPWPRLRISFWSILLSFIIAVVLNSFWIIPLVQYGFPNTESFTTLEAFKYYSFAKFEYAISLLHPNWPENIFGKVYFMKSEYLALAVIAFIPLLLLKNFSNNIERLKIVCFSLLALTGSFLAKGTNEPFGEINQFLFDIIPGFQMFRDPTKWYVLIAISYSYLIPRSILLINDYMYKTFNNNIFKTKINLHFLRNVIGAFFLVYFMYLSRQGALGQLSGTFKTRSVPSEYIKLKNTINQPQYFTTLWIPKYQRFGLSTGNHIALDGQNYFSKNSVNEILNELSSQESYQRIIDDSIKYIIVPFDSEHEIYIKDRKYNDNLYRLTVKEVKKIKWLKELPGFEKVRVFEVMKK